MRRRELGSHEEYERATLSESDLNPDPFAQFAEWLDVALTSEPVGEPNAMTLATVSADGSPSARVVLLREVDKRGFVFFTNYESRKGAELSVNPRVAAVFYWPALERQIRIEGIAEKIEPTASDEYFASRPVRSQMAAVVSNQSDEVENREVLEAAMWKLEAQHADGMSITRPSYWGGYRIVPQTFEFWQGRKSRLHDRLRYQFVDGAWQIDRLAP